MEKHHERELKEIMSGQTCPKEFTCYQSGFKNLRKAKDIGLESFVECLEKDLTQCEFAVEFGGYYFCKCAVRVYIAKKLKK